MDGLLRRAFAPLGEALFSVIVAGEAVAAEKPAPDVFLVALQRLGLAALSCVTFEDSANGVTSAHRAGLAAIATPSIYISGHDFSSAISVISNWGEPDDSHRHLAGREWPEGVITVRGLQQLSVKIRA